MNRVMLREEAAAMFGALWSWQPPDEKMQRVKDMFLERHADWAEYARSRLGDPARAAIKLVAENARRVEHA